MLTLRDYQSDIIARTRDELRRHRSVLVCSATGSGKTALAAYMIARASERGKRCWFMTHRDFLLTQTSAALDTAGVPHGFVAAGREFNPYQRVAVCSVDTLRRRLDRLTPPDLIIWDEVHHIAAKSWGAVYQWAANARHIGLSATPARLDGKGLSAFFGALVCGPTVRWLIDHGFLSGYRAFAPGGAPDLTGVGKRAGDYVTRELAGVMDTGQIAGNIVSTYQRLANGLRAIYYAVSVDHSRHLVEQFRAAGVAAAHLDGASSSQERSAAARYFASGRLAVLGNVELFGEGFDLAASAGRDVSVEAVGLCRPTQSLTLHLQQIGRALRPKSEPAIILDHAGNCMRHGLPDDDRAWSLDGIIRASRQQDDGPAVRMCPGPCYAVYSASLRGCPYCGAHPVLTPREVEEIQADLVEADAELLRAAKAREVQRARTEADLIRIGFARGYKNPIGWARHVVEGREYKQGRTRLNGSRQGERGASQGAG